MRIGVLLAIQTPTDSPSHFVSKRIASLLCVERIRGQVIAVWISNKVIWLKIKDSFAELKQRFVRGTAVLIPVMLPRRTEPENLNLSYPPKNYESDGRRKQKELWLNATRF